MTYIEFLQAIFHTLPEGAKPGVRGFPGNPSHEKGWAPTLVTDEIPSEINEHNNIYFCLSSLTRPSATYSAMAALHAVMLDDIGDKLPLEEASRLPHPSWIVETSHNNFQYGYILKEPIEDKLLARHLTKHLAEKARSDEGAKNPVRWTRLPFGMNTKYDPPQSTKLTEFTGELYSADQLIELFEIPKPVNQPATTPTSSTTSTPNSITPPDPLFDWLHANNYFERQDTQGWWILRRCPWTHEHASDPTNGSGSAYAKAYEACHDGIEYKSPRFTCRHGSCISNGRNTQDLESWAVTQGYEPPDQLDIMVQKIQSGALSPEDAAHEISLTTTYSKPERELLAKALQPMFAKHYGGTKPPIQMVRDKLKVRTDEKIITVTPEWLSNWCFLAGEGRFYNTNKRTDISPTSFNYSNVGHYKADPHRFDYNAAADLALDVYNLPVYDTVLYSPGEAEVFEHRGLTCVNSWDNRYLENLKATPTAKGLAAVQRLEQHFHHLIKDPRDVELLLSVLAFTVQHPEKRIAWATLLKGCEGDGKSIASQMMATAIGNSNVENPTADNIINDRFTDWAGGSMINFVEEIRIVGKSRYDILNKLKPFISNPTISVRPLGKKAYDVQNPLSYVMFTNEEEGLPIHQGDRRYFLCRTRFADKFEMLKYYDNLYGSASKYFEDLWDAARDYPVEILQWLYNYELHPDFIPHGRAPDNSTKERMIDAMKPDEERFIEELLEQDNLLYVSHYALTIDALSTVARQAEYAAQYPKLGMNDDQRWKRPLHTLGFRSYSRLRHNGKRHSIWIHKELPNPKELSDTAVIREFLDQRAQQLNF